ncbi:MAG: thioredoxin [Planctomycetota bacterium]|nr:MAG: thioredoxin [Planctomycetota bacterium]REJ90990.1 MAG: thioredoxin [Planctomycetota bacterium]REK25473.1 MAG: thioredoxin [Planctomycetota bacterium]REK40823.1 MAG: thioredoxin [Planctomycetota bacterium]
MHSLRIAPAVALAAGVLFLFATTVDAKPPKIKDALKLKPIQRDVTYDQPTAAEAAKCTIDTENDDRQHGWVVRNADGQVLRRFVDTNRDKVVDRWCYFRAGVEVYRDVDSDFNGKVDQHRWLNTAGRRWAIDKNEDGTIDRWRAISAEEVSAEVVAALATRDSRRFARLLLTSDELKQLGLGKSTQQRLATAMGSSVGRFDKLAKQSRQLSSDTRWIDFSAVQPGIVPAGENGSTKDVIVYENVAAMVDTKGKQGLVHIGTLIEVGDVWRVVSAPRLSGDGATADASGDSFFFRQVAASVPSGSAPSGGTVLTDEVQKLLAQLEKLEPQIATAKSPSAMAKLNAQRAEILEQLYSQAQSDEERDAWGRQLADMLSTAAQSGGLPDGVERLNRFSKKLAKQKSQRDLAAYARYRAMMAAYSMDMQSPKADFVKIQEQWLKDLNTFVKEFPTSPDAPDAMLQLATAEEFAGEEDKAKSWYGRIVKEFANSDVARKAEGAMRRLNSVGKVISIRGKDFKNRNVSIAGLRKRYVLVQYWATWCEPCKEDMEDLTDLVSKYGRKGFAILGVNVDNDRATAQAFLQKSKFPGRIDLYEPGGLDSRLANEMGVLTLPTMLLVDPKGKVINRNIHVGELEDELKKRLK